MLLKRWFWLFATLLFTGLSLTVYLKRVRRRTFRASPLCHRRYKGTWRGAKETLTFNANGTVIYRGKRYYYAVSNGGTIQLTGKQGSSTIPYQLAGGNLTLTVDGRATVYTRRR